MGLVISNSMFNVNGLSKIKKEIREINEINILPFLNQKPSLRFTLASGAALITGYKWLVGKRPINLTALVGPHSPEIKKKKYQTPLYNVILQWAIILYLGKTALFVSILYNFF